MLDALLRAGLRRSLFVHAQGMMDFCDRLHCLIRQFHFLRMNQKSVRALSITFAMSRSIHCHGLQNFRRLRHVAQ